MMRSPVRRLRGFALARNHDIPLYRQVYEHIRTAIRSGQLRPGDRLPSTRSLAELFGTARGTMDAAYAILAGEGYLVARGAAGTVVSAQLDSRAIAGAAGRPRIAPPAVPAVAHAPQPFQMGLPALDAFPRKVWSRLVARHARGFAPADMAYPDPAGYAPLREAIAGYLATSRAVLCKAGQILITNGYQDALNLAAGVLLLRGDKVWLEDPNYAPTSEALTAAGATLVPINVDAEGLRVSDGLTRARHARLAVVTPSHQSPLGVALSLPRRLALLSWASAAGAWIIEDDYDSEFHYVGPPATGAEKPRSRRARSLCRNLQQGFVPEPAARLLGPTGIAGCRLRALQSCATSGACDARAARGCRFHGRGLLRAPSQTHACPLFGTPPGVGGRP